jgi:hypothetical protein
MTYKRATAAAADQIAKRWLKTPMGAEPLDPGVLRDFCDQASGGDLSNYQLNRLTDMVERRVS